MSGQIKGCPVCGQQKQAIPAGGVCPACGANPQMSDMLNADMFGSSQKNAQSSTEPLVNRYTPREPAQKLTLGAWMKGMTLSMVVWGLGAAMVMALVIGLLAQLLFGSADMGAFWGGANTGFLLGVILGSTWGAARKDYVGILGDVLIGVIVGAVWSALGYLRELILIAPPNEPMYLYVLIGGDLWSSSGYFVCRTKTIY
jgi:hypothetical protein